MSRLVPPSLRSEWREEWEAEIHAYPLDRRNDPDVSRRLLMHALGGVGDALWLRKNQWSLDPMNTDLGFALRQLKNRPGFAAVAVLVLAIGIGANTAMFSVVNGVLLQPLPFPESERLVMFYETNPERGWTRAEAAAANYLDWRERMKTMSEIGASFSFPFRTTLTGRGEPLPLVSRAVTAEYMKVLGVGPELGRVFESEETWSGGEAVAILSHRLWVETFSKDNSIIGSRIELDRSAVTVVGVMPADFEFPTPDTDLWVPVGWDPAARTAVWFRRAHGLRAIGRLAEGATLESARQELKSVAAQLSQEYPETNTEMGAGLMPLHEWVTGDSKPPLLILFGAVGLVLLIACANVANLLLVRGASRTQELAVRSALGAGRSRLIRQLLTESLVLSVLGASIGLILGIWGSKLLLALSPSELPRAGAIAIDWTVVLFLVALTLGTALLFGLLPALEASRKDLGQFLASRVFLGSMKQRWTRSALVVAEVALALILVAGAGLMIRTFLNLSQVDPGFRPENVLTFRLIVPRSDYDTHNKLDGLFLSLLERVAELPGVQEASATSALPLSTRGWSGDFAIQGRDREEYGVGFRHKGVYPGYFRTLGVPLISGRDFETADRDSNEPVVIINRTLARRFFSNQDPIGQRLTLDRYPTEDSRWRTIVGVVENEKRSTVQEEPLMFIYESLQQNPRLGVSIAIRTEGPPTPLVPAVREIARDLDPNLPLNELSTMESLLGTSLKRERFFMSLLGGFAVAALFLAALGIHGLLAYTVRQRSHELGVRMAVGASFRDVRKLVVSQGLVLTSIGLVVGLAGALVLTRLMDSLLFEVGAQDPLTLATVTLILLCVSLLACYLPARRATRVDPVVILRCEG